MAPKRRRDAFSLKWIHEVREEHYQTTKGMPLEAWLQPVDPVKAARACHRLGIKVRVGRTAKRRIA